MIPRLILKNRQLCGCQLITSAQKWTTFNQFYHVYSQCRSKLLPCSSFSHLLTCVRNNNGGQNHQMDTFGESLSSAQILEESKSLMLDNNHRGLHDNIRGLVKQVYSDLHTVPWIHHHNLPIAIMQLLLNNKSDLYLDPINKHHTFESILGYVERNLDQIPDEDIPGYFHSFLFLGTDYTFPIIHKLLYRMQDTKLNYGTHNMALICDSLRIFPRGDFKLWGRILHWLDLIYKERDFSSPHINIYDLSRVITNTRQLSTPDKLNTAFKFVHDMVVHNKDLTLKQLGSCLRMNRHLSFLVTSTNKDLIKDYSNYIIDLLLPQLPTFTCDNYADVCHVLKVMGLYGEETSRKFQKQALEILHSNNLKISELVNLGYAFNYTLSPPDRHFVESMLYKDLGDADVLLLSNIADILVDMRCKNSDLINYYAEMVKQNMGTLKHYVTRFYKVFRFLNRSHINHQDKFLFQEILNLLNSQQGLSVWTVSTLSSFLLPQCKPVIPDILMSKLLNIIPQSDINNIALILIGINKMRRPWVRQMYQQVLQLQTLLYQNVEGRLHEVHNIEVIIQMLQVLYVKNEMKEIVLLENLMNKLTEFMDDLTLKQFRYICILFNQIKYIQPEVFNKMTQYLLDNENSVAFSDVTSFVRIISFLGFQPTSSEEFERFLTRQLEKNISKIDLPQQLSFSINLCKLNIFIDSWLSKLFSYEFIEKIDEYIELNPSSRRNIMMNLMLLNRCVVLECPHLDIPWFHEDFCQQNITRDSYSDSWMHQEIESALKETLGNTKFYRSSVFTPYFFILDFECLLDKNKKPVNVSIANELHLHEEGYQRVAISLQLEKYFSSNSRHLLGHNQMNQRHLEILGYKTVEIPHYEWNSMALSNWAGKVEYLSKKIFR
ncbi:FAST kinase domain-containing protein 1, mitochondrial-like [Argonauta hians]